jgi:type IV secretory pathway VirB6-like protein
VVAAAAVMMVMVAAAAVVSVTNKEYVCGICYKNEGKNIPICLSEFILYQLRTYEYLEEKRLCYRSIRFRFPLPDAVLPSSLN